MTADSVARIYLAIAVMAALAYPAPALAGQISGDVTDPQGLAVPGAHVTIHCAGRRDSTKSDAHGQFVFQAARSGECSLMVKHPGFAAFEQRIEAGSEHMPVRLELAEVRHSVDVVADDGSPNLLERRVNSISLSDEELKLVSNNTEDWIRYAKLQAGVAFGEDAIYVDGMPATNLPPAGAVAQISVNADPFSAEYADGDNTHIDITTKGGNRTFGFNLGGLSLGAGGRNVLAPSLKSESRSGQGNFNGYIPHLPVTFTGHLTFGQKDDEVPILAVFPAAASGTLRPSSASVANNSFSGTLDTFYSHRGMRAHVLLFDSRNDGSNTGVGGVTLPEAGVTSRYDSREVRATVNEGGEGLLYQGGIVVAEKHSVTSANSTGASVTVPGAFVDGGSAMTSNESEGTHWTLKGVVQSGAFPSSWSTGVTVSGENDAKREIPNTAGSFTFPDLQAYSDALAGAGTGTWILTRGNGAASYSGVSAAPFFQKTLLHSKRWLLSGGLRGDYQSGFGIMASPRLSGAAEWHRFIFRAGAGLFARDVRSNVLLRAIANDPAHLYETLVTGASLLEDTYNLPPAGDNLIHTHMAGDLARPRELMEKASVERRLGKFTTGVESTWTHDRHLFGSQRLPYDDGWMDLLESNRSSDRERVHSQVRYTWHGQSVAAHYEWIRSHDDTAGPFSFPALQNDLRAEWARSAGVAPHNVILSGNLKLPKGISLIVTDTWRGSSPYNITTGLDPEKDGLFMDRGGLARNSGNGPSFNSLSLYGYRRIPVPFLAPKGKRVYVDLGVRAENILGDRDYTSVGSVVGSPTFGQPLSALPGRAVRFWVNLD